MNVVQWTSPQDSDYEYASSDNDLFSIASINEVELDDMDELGAVSPYEYLAPEDDIESVEDI